MIYVVAHPTKRSAKAKLTHVQELWTLAKLFSQKCCDCERICNDDKKSHYAKANRPEGIPLVKVHIYTKYLRIS